MHSTTTLGEPLKSVGIDPRKDKVREYAADALHKFKTEAKARERFVSVVKQKRIIDTALEMLFSRLADEIAGKANGGVQTCREGQQTPGAADQSAKAAGAVHMASVSQPDIGDTQSSTGDGVHNSSDGQILTGSSSVGTGAVQSTTESQLPHGRADLPAPPPGFFRNENGQLRRHPNKPRITPEILDDVRDNVASIFQTYKLPNGVEIGRIKVGSIQRLIGQFNGVIRDHRVAVRVLNFVRDHVQPTHWGSTVQEVIRPSDLAKVISDAEEVCRHAA